MRETVTALELVPGQPALYLCSDIVGDVEALPEGPFPDVMYDGVVYGISAWNPQQSAAVNSCEDNNALNMQLLVSCGACSAFRLSRL